ncbi:MAG TPA: hypothetical protein VFR15_07905, partial [Chloroflexia bacterium]|nr:hypothetical protein [Chloroflexia bacterium]
MSTLATQETVASDETPRTLPYAPGWVDRLTDRVRALPLPPWLTYLWCAIALAAVQTAVKWSDGTYPVPEVFTYHLAIAATGPTVLALLHYLDDWAGSAL